MLNAEKSSGLKVSAFLLSLIAPSKSPVKYFTHARPVYGVEYSGSISMDLLKSLSAPL